MNRSAQGLALLAVASGTAILGACSESLAPIQFPRPRVRPEWVTGEAAGALDSATGLFRIPYPLPAYVTLPVADALAVAAARLLGSPSPFNTARALLEHDRGAPIDFEHLRVCERAVYVFSPFGEFPAPVPGYLRRGWGAQWAIALCGPDAAAQLSIGVPDNPMHLQVVDDTLANIGTPGGGSDFNGAGVPRQFPYGLPLTPEGAVEVIFRMTMRRTSSIPVAFDQHDDRGIGELPLCASWRVTLEAPVTVRSEKTGALFSASEFFARRAPGCYSDDVVLYVASAAQPTTGLLVFPRDTISTDLSLGIDTVAVPLSGPVLFERISVIR